MPGQITSHGDIVLTDRRCGRMLSGIRAVLTQRRRTAGPCLAASLLLAVWASTAVADGDPLHVAPLDEIVVLDPRIDSEGKPAVIVQPGQYGEQQVEIPPAVIVHKYYYSGDRDFQGPRFPGGPSIVVVNHPVSGERLYVEVQMLPGAPRVTYRRNYIDYDFGKRAVRIKFGHFVHLGHASRPKVSYRKGHSLALDITEKRREATERTVSWLRRSGIADAAKATADGMANVFDATADGVRTAGQFVASPVIQVINATPVGSLLTRSREERAIRDRDAAVRRAANKTRRLSESIPTLR